MSRLADLFSDAETAENLSKQRVRIHMPGNRTDGVMRQAQFFRGQFGLRLIA
jgi:hypothetical protein